MTYGLGIDTGGTYTDSVITDLDTGEILSRAKALTTRDDLVKGISESIGRHGRDLLKEVGLVSLSSTLATNSVVEGKGCRAGLICIGRDYDQTVPADVYRRISGSHDLRGNVKVPLNEDEAVRALEDMKGRIDALAITGYLAVRNPEHEERVAEIARGMLDVPVVLGHELSSGLGFNERSTTALMNARLTPVIADLVASVKQSLSSFGIDAPLMIVKGDGTVINEEEAVKRPVETVLSGPASSLTGAKALTGLDDAIMVDIGGTTTDIGVLRGGFPRLEKEGALIGGKRTRVLAAAVSTFGIGGDSRIVVNGTRTELTPVRVIPVCIAASRWPNVARRLSELASAVPDRAAESSDTADLIQPTEFFTPARKLTTESLQECDRRFLELIRDEPKSLEEAGEILGVLPYAFNASRLERLGLVTRIGVTPSDILHAEGSYVQYDAEASRNAVGYLARKSGVSVDEYIASVKDMVVRKIATSIAKDLMLEDGGFEDLDSAAEDLVDKAVTGRKGMDFSVRITLDKPIVGIGAPVGSWLPKVAEIFGTELVLPKDSNVGNAVGAISGSVSRTVKIHIQPCEGAIGPDPRCIVFLDSGNVELPSYHEAETYAVERARDIAEDLCRRAGASVPSIETSIDKKTFGTASGGSLGIFLEADVVARATGKPNVLRGRCASARPPDGAAIVAGREPFEVPDSGYIFSIPAEGADPQGSDGIPKRGDRMRSGGFLGTSGYL